jgi:hypothetical protein
LSADLADLDDRGASGEFMEVIEEFPVAVGAPNLSDFFPAIAPLDPQRLRARLVRVFKKLHTIFDEQIERRMQERAAGDPPKNDFLDLFLDYRGAEDGRGFDRQTLMSLLTVTPSSIPPRHTTLGVLVLRVDEVFNTKSINTTITNQFYY